MTLTVQAKKSKRGIKKSLIDREQHVKIWGFMLTDLNLQKTELLVYAVIFSMYKYNMDNFNGSREYLQTWCNCGKSAEDNALNSLVAKQLLIRDYTQFKNVRVATYAINPDMLPDCEMFANENRYRRAKEAYDARREEA